MATVECAYMSLPDYLDKYKALPSKMSDDKINSVKKALAPLIGKQFKILSLPYEILPGFEPSQIGTMIGTLIDACIPQFHKILEDESWSKIGIERNPGILGEREGYPDYKHESGMRLELKLLYVDNVALPMKKPPTPREPSARLTQKVTFKNVKPDTDLLFVLAYSLKEDPQAPGMLVPTIVDFELFPVIECVLARDLRMYDSGGGWFGNFDTPAILSNAGKRKRQLGQSLDFSGYGRKEDEGRDFNEDTNFGKLKRIPYEPLASFLKKHRAGISCPISHSSQELSTK